MLAQSKLHRTWQLSLLSAKWSKQLKMKNLTGEVKVIMKRKRRMKKFNRLINLLKLYQRRLPQ